MKSSRRLLAACALSMTLLSLVPIALATSVTALDTQLGGESVSEAESHSGDTSAADASAGDASARAPSPLARNDIPALYLQLYHQAAEAYGLDWAILAAVGKVECDHGRDPDPSCTQHGAVNGAGAGGPAQFLASTWSRYGRDGDGDGKADRWDPADAIMAMGNYLHASGAPQNYAAALDAYNHAGWYVKEVEHWASLYRGATPGGVTPGGATPGSVTPGSVTPGGATPAVSAEEGDFQASSTPVVFTSGWRAQLAPGDGHLALIPTQAPAVVQAMLVAGNELQELPYGPSGHPDPRGASSEDCSSTLNYVLYRAGVRPIAQIVQQNPLAQSYIHWGEPGPGRWVSIYATSTPTAHVFVVIAGLRLDTSRHGTDVGPNRAQAGPRWRILDHIPMWAHWSVRHPAGL